MTIREPSFEDWIRAVMKTVAVGSRPGAERGHPMVVYCDEKDNGLIIISSQTSSSGTHVSTAGSKRRQVDKPACDGIAKR